MKEVNRSVIVVRAKEPFLQWLNSLPDPGNAPPQRAKDPPAPVHRRFSGPVREPAGPGPPAIAPTQDPGRADARHKRPGRDIAKRPDRRTATVASVRRCD